MATAFKNTNTTMLRNGITPTVLFPPTPLSDSFPNTREIIITEVYTKSVYIMLAKK